MAWGYEKCFTIEHDNTLKRRIDCKDCIYYDSSDKSCMKRPLYLPVDGYNSWRNCKYFELDHSVSHYDEKSLQYVHELARRKIQREQQSQQKKTTGVKKTVQTKQAVKPKEKGIPVVHDEKIARWFFILCGRDISEGKEASDRISTNYQIWWFRKENNDWTRCRGE